MFRGLIGPYGGTPESESKRPTRLTLKSILTIFIMLLLLLLAWAIVGNFIGPTIVIITSLLQRRKPKLGQDFASGYKFVVEFLYFTGLILTLYAIFIGGLPIEWQRKNDELIVSFGFVVEEIKIDTEVGEGRLWFMSDEWSTSVIDEGVSELTEGQLVLRQEIAGKSWHFPIWLDTFRWIVVLTIVVAELLCIVLLARQITETLLPSLPNSVRANPGLLARLFPFLTIKYEKEDNDDDDDDDVMPGSGEEAPWR